MGFGVSSQKTTGIHTRLFSRAFVFEDDQGQKSVFVSVDACMIGHLIKKKVIENLQSAEWGLGDSYTFENVLLSATHTHSGPAGFLQYLLFQFTSLGFVPQTFDAMVYGITKSIYKAHHNLQPAQIYYNEGALHNANINRSPTAYLENPENERQKFEHNTDHTVYQLNIFHAHTDEPIGNVKLLLFCFSFCTLGGASKLLVYKQSSLRSQIAKKSNFCRFSASIFNKRCSLRSQ